MRVFVLTHLLSVHAEPLACLSLIELGTLRTHLLTQVQNKYDNCQNHHACDTGDSNPRYPASRPQKQFSFPTITAPIWRRHDDDARVGYYSFHIDVVVWCVDGCTNEEILNIIVGAAQTKERVGGLECMVGRLRKLANW